MKFAYAFEEMDSHLKENLKMMTCHELFEIKNDFYNNIESLCGSTANFTGITELLIFRFIYHSLGMKNPVINKTVQQKNNSINIGKRYVGKNNKYQEPDIVIEENGAIKYLFSIKNQLNTTTPNNNEKISPLVQDLLLHSGTYTTSIQDIYRIENIRHGIHTHFKSLTIVFSKVQQKHEITNNLIHKRFKWHNFLILENNLNPFLKELKDKLDFKSV
ncbi:hypothetical protein GLV94_02475 [Virgibacillus halodenitrificans]|uniref:hypothetical protein n=1 Tax=Virgibacillus halodenitrificans TaxID=1482 RepID=UPI00136AF7C9|nr:hypothetical protein [Virgibacillus halodenitrificans]MYL44499.1 hypothetical protein [Virgibacillus halodenitrificans]